jgi:CheY-like chemotaxis protein
MAAAIRNLVSSRSAPIPSTIPPKARRSAEPQEESLLPSKNEASPKVEPAKPPKKEPGGADTASETPEARPLEMPETPSAEGEVPAETPSPAAASSRNEALIRLKKRTRGLVVLADSAHGELLQAHLIEEGYGRVILVRTWEEVVPYLKQPNVGLFLIDTSMPILESFEMLHHIQEQDVHFPPVVLAAEEVSRALVLAAHRAGVSQLLLKPYVMDDDFSSLIEQQMGLA